MSYQTDATTTGSSPRPHRSPRLRTQLMWVLTGRVLAAALQAVLMLMLARSVSPAEFGFFAAPYGLATVLQTVFDLGLPTLAVKARAVNVRDGRITNLLRMNSRLSAVMALAMLLLAAAFGAFVDDRYYMLLPLAIWAAAERNADAWLGIALADGDVWVNMCNLVARRMLNLSLFAIFIFALHFAPLFAFALSSAVSAVASNLFAKRFVVRRLAPAATMYPLGAALRESWPYWLTSVSTQLRNADVALTSAMAGVTQAGFYGASSRLTGPLRLFATSLASLLLPAASRRTGKALARLVKSLVFVVIVSAIGYGVLAVVAPVAVPLVLGKSYAGAVPSIQLILISLVFASATALLEAVLQGVNQERFVATSAAVTSILALLGVGLGAAYAGATGAALGLGIATTIQSILLFGRLWLHMSRHRKNEGRTS